MKQLYKITPLILIFLLSTVGYMIRFEESLRIYSFHNVTNSSMSPYIRKGSVIVSKSTKDMDIKKGDVIVFRYPIDMSQKISHRVVDIGYEEGRYYKTRGDANDSDDPWQIRQDLIVGKVIWIIPYLGFAVSFSQSKVGLFLMVVLPLGIISASEVSHLKEELKMIYEKSRRTLFVRRLILKIHRMRRAMMLRWNSIR